MTPLEILKSLIGEDLPLNDSNLEFYLEKAGNIICSIRNSNIVEPEYITTQISMALELYNKEGVEGQIGHSELGISRTYTTSDISTGLLMSVTPIAKTPFSKVRIIE